MMKPTRKSSRMHNRRILEYQAVYLPLCIISEILSKLPAESVVTCRRVCKSWNKLTKESTFMKKHFEWSQNHEANRYLIQAHYASDQSLLLFDINEKKTRKIPLFNQMQLPMSIYPNHHGYSIVSSCNGLLCLRPKGSMDNVIICNPITKHCLMLPASNSSSFMPWRSYQLGFHFNSSSRKYKVVREFQFLDNLPSKFQIITVGETSWKDLTPPNFVVESGFNGAVFWNEGFHWKVSEFANGHGNSGILRFDLMEEKFSTILLTADNDISRNFRVIGLRGELKIVEHYRSRFLKIWKVIGNKVDGFSLFLQYTYVFCVPPSRMLQYDVVGEIDEETYLMQVNAWNRGVNISKLELFYATMPTKLEELMVASFPRLFKIISYKPSLYSPLTL